MEAARRVLEAVGLLPQDDQTVLRDGVSAAFQR